MADKFLKCFRTSSQSISLCKSCSGGASSSESGGGDRYVIYVEKRKKELAHTFNRQKPTKLGVYII